MTPIKIDSAKITKTGITLPPRITKAQWVAIGRKLGEATNSAFWSLGDWLNAGVAKFGEEKAMDELVKIGELDGHPIARFAYLASRVPTEQRRADLTWAHHEAAARAGEQMTLLLNRVDGEGMTVQSLLDEVEKLNPGKARPEVYVQTETVKRVAKLVVKVDPAKLDENQRAALKAALKPLYESL